MINFKPQYLECVSREGYTGRTNERREDTRKEGKIKDAKTEGRTPKRRKILRTRGSKKEENMKGKKDGYNERPKKGR